MTQKKLVRIKGNTCRYYYSKYQSYDMEFPVYEVEDVMTHESWSTPSYDEMLGWCRCKTSEERKVWERMYA